MDFDDLKAFGDAEMEDPLERPGIEGMLGLLRKRAELVAGNPRGHGALSVMAKDVVALLDEIEQLKADRDKALELLREAHPVAPPMLHCWNLNDVQERKDGWWVGHTNDDDVFSPVILVDTANYYAPDHSEPIARHLLALLAVGSGGSGS